MKGSLLYRQYVSDQLSKTLPMQDDPATMLQGAPSFYVTYLEYVHVVFTGIQWGHGIRILDTSLFHKSWGNRHGN